MGRERTFKLHPRFPVLARTPLLPAASNRPSGMLSGSFLEALRFASRSLAAVTDRDLDVDERLATTVRAYERRARTRATPRGAFAGVQVAQVTTESARFTVGTNHWARSVPSATWLSEVASRLIEVSEVLETVHLASNDLVVRRGNRFEHEYATGSKKPERVTLRATAAVERILETCRAPASLRQIGAAINERWPGVPDATVRTTVLAMVRAGVLLTDLLPVDVARDPLRHLLARIPAAHELTAELAGLRDLLAEADKYPPGVPERLAALGEAREVCDRIARQENPITVDVTVDADIRIPASLADEAVQAASLLWSTTPSPGVLDAYHSRFVERFGMRRRVPLMHVVDPVVGLGNPDDGERPDPIEDNRRARVLADLVADAAARSSTEVELGDEAIAALGVTDDSPAPASGELYAQVLARSQQDAADGRHLLAAHLGSTQDAGSTLGRFASLLELPAPGGSASPVDEPLVAEVVVRPRLAALTTVTLPSGFAPMRICVGVLPGPGDLTLTDLELASDGTRLRLWSRAHDREIVPRLFSRIGPAYVPPAVRLLQDLANAGSRPWHGWTWGPLHEAPFLPQVRWQRIILSPARWRLPNALIAAVDDTPAWESELKRWRTTTLPRLPQVVVTQDTDQRLPLDLDDPRDRVLLRRYVRRGADAVTSPPGGADAVQAVADGPNGRHVTELIIPFQGDRSPDQELHLPTVATPPVVHHPGGHWLSLAIESPADHHDDLLFQMGDLVNAVGDGVDRWFWLRYDNRAHGPHLRIRFNGDASVLNTVVLPAVSARCASWVDRGLVGQFVVESYEPEIDRYGGPNAIDAAEQLFHADSALVLRFLADRPETETRLLLAAYSAVETARNLAGSDLDAVGRIRLGRAARRRVNELRATAPQNPWTLLNRSTRVAWDLRCRATAEYREHVSMSRRADCASSVIHMHASRMGLGHDDERIARALAAQLLARGVR